ncbi:transglycosylase family protein [Streptomyces sp. NPDC007355]|uniref:transglycosylase family protein n=1 Tax=Streptomyces sp. NPDC007355 TaxID=3364778 RepID=UPI0036CA9E57
MHHHQESVVQRRSKRLLSLSLAISAALPALFAATTQSAAAAAPDVWDRLASCESSDNWSSNTGNGFYGGLQFTTSTWTEFGGNAYASSAHLASREQQIEIAEKVLQSQGPGAWPVCSTKAGLTKDLETSRDISTPEVVSEPATNGTVPSKVNRMAACAPVSGLTIISTKYRQAGSWAAGFHTGVDFAVPGGTSVWAAVPGTVVSAGWQGAYGISVVIQHDDGMYSVYAHLSTAAVAQGMKVTAGQQVGLSGSTGNSSGPHLHFEVRSSNSYSAHVDPLAYLRGLGVAV